MATDISSLIPKTENGGTTNAGKLSAEEFNLLVTAVMENQEAVAELLQNAVYEIRQGSTSYTPVNHVVSLPGANTTVSVLTKDNTDKIVSIDGSAKLHLRFTSVDGGSDTAEIVVVQIQVYQVGEWVTKGTIQVATRGYNFDPTAANAYDEYDISEYLSPGENQVRIQATGVETGVTGRLIFSSVVLTQLYLVNQQNYNVPIDASTGLFTLAYQVYGSVDKKIHIQITGSQQTLTLEYPLGTTQYTTDNYTRAIAEQTGYGILSHGVHTVTAWLTCEDGEGNTIESDRLVNRFMVINNASATVAQRTQPYIMIQEMKSQVTNYVQTTLCGYAVFVPKYENGEISLDTNASLNLAFIISNYSEHAISDSNLVEYLRVEEIVPTNVRRNLNVTVEIEPSSDSSEEATSYDAYFHCWRRTTDIEGNITGTYDILQESIGTDMINIMVDNSDSFAPTSGSTFLINPKVRNNTESNFRRILNARDNNAVIPSTWEGFSGVNDGWIVSPDDGQKILRVLAGQKLTIQYNPFVQFLTNPESSMTMEFDIKVRNVTDPESAQIIGINETDATDMMIGLRMDAIRGYLLTTSNNVEGQQDWQWQEDVRTHISININHSVVAETGATPMSLVRVLINGVINREFNFATNRYNEFCTAALSNGGIVIGSSAADIDIYSIRVYTNRQLSATNIVKNYISTLPTSAEKLKVRSENDILDSESGLISATKVRAKGKRVLIYHGVEPYQFLSAKQKCYWEVYQYKADGTIDPDCSGTICKASYLAYLQDDTVKCLVSSRQGSTANTYYYSNIQTKIKDVDFLITVSLADIHSSIVVTNNGDGTVTLAGGLVDGTYEVTNNTIQVQDGWIDTNGKYRGKGFQVSPNVPLGQKMVNKINYASAMQSHLCGGVRSYNDLHTAIVGKNSLQQANSLARVAKYTEPFFFFTQETEGSTPLFRGGCTFGPGKMDDPTWGYNKKQHANFAMLEGAENNSPLTDMRVPWDHKVLPHFDGDECDGWGYPTANEVNIDLDKFKSRTVDGKKVTTAAVDEIIQNTWNFLYWHNPRMTYYNGTYEQLMDDSSLDRSMAYWVTQGTYRYCLFRFDWEAEVFVHAGMWNSTNNTYDQRNLGTDPITSGAITGDNQSNYAALNSAFIAAIVAHAKANIGTYFKVASLQFHYAYVNFFIAGTDNCSKNTYYVIDPATNKFELHQDDLDTIFPTDNTGRQTKPYYIDRMHPYAEGSTTSLYEGGANVLFNLCELMYENTLELQSMMHQIFTTMSSMVNASDDLPGLEGAQKTTPWGFLHKYFFSVQEYFPAVAWNEQARIRYEYPASTGFVSTGGRAVPPITQSIGNQLEAEKQYMRRRLVYAASYAAWGDFEYATTGSTGLGDTASSFGFQGYPNPDGTVAQYTIQVTPHQYIYPTANIGGNTIDPHIRLAPGQTYNFNLGSVNGDTGVAIFASNYYRNFGNVGNISCKADSTFTLNGKRLISFTANPTVFYVDSQTGNSVPAFRPQQVVIGNANGLKTISFNGCVGIRGSFDGTSLIRATNIDLSGTSFTEVNLPESDNLIEAHLPGRLTTIQVDNVPNIKTLTLDGYQYLSTIRVGSNVGAFNSYALAFGAFNANANVVTLQIENIHWTSASAAMIEWLANIPTSILTGSMIVNEPSSGSSITFAMKALIISKWGNVDDANSAEHQGLLMTYNKTILTSAGVGGNTYTHEADADYQYIVNPSSRYANNFTKITWSVTDPSLNGQISMNPKTGVLHVTQLSSEADFVTVGVAIETLNNGTYSTINGSKSVGIYDRPAEIGDYVYADGSYSDSLDEDKTPIGQCFYINPEDSTDRRMVALQDTAPTTRAWGLYNDATNGFAGITLDDEPTYSVYDIVSIDNITSGISTNYITDETYRDETSAGDADGFKVFAANTAPGDMQLVTLTTDILGHQVGEKMPSGKLKTLKIIQHRNKILNDSGINLPIPIETATETEYQNVTTCINNLVSANGNTAKYQQYYYPAASYCYAYEPTVLRAGEVLADKFKKHNWYLPSSGELCRMYWYKSKGYTIGVSHAIFAKSVTAGVFRRWTESWYWSSSECSASYAWNVNFDNGGVDGYYKCNNLYVRAVAAF